MSNNIEDVKKKLDGASSCFCLAKWLQVTIHLQNGHTHSCHHPFTHKVPLEELAKDSSALHNTQNKKLSRKKMLAGERPAECGYCWNIEDSKKESISDRILKSANDIHEFDRISKLPWDASVNPNYLEVSFGNECNFKCAYCAPHISSSIMNEYQKFGPYSSIPDLDIDTLKRDGLFPYTKDEHNPYVEAFWKWWEEVRNELKIFRITGGEPLINSNTFKFLDSIIENPLPELEIGINSNLGIPDASFEKFLNKAEYIVKNKLVKKISLFTSVDTYGKNGEFIRFGMNYEGVMKNVRAFLTRIPEAELNFMSTYNAFSIVNFNRFLMDVTELKKTYRTREGMNRVHLDTPYLRNPIFLSTYSLTENFYPHLRRDIEYLHHHSTNGDPTSLYVEAEVTRLERILHWLESMKETRHKESVRAELYVFLQEYQKRKGIKFLDYCPEYAEFYTVCKLAYLSRT